MPTTPPLDNKQEPAENTADQVTPDLDRDTLIRLLESCKLLGPTTTYCMTREEMAEAPKDMMEKAERGYYEPLYFREKRIMDEYISCVGPVCSIQMQEEVKDNDC